MTVELLFTPRADADLDALEADAGLVKRLKEQITILTITPHP